ncbi:hypothetical protein C8Q80DRAFT_1265500 [Daedaleopsis nitida]|nr:hypothetical protein C8Q80DRAFT_1265500 [Daedaleopsis nitida]
MPPSVQDATAHRGSANRNVNDLAFVASIARKLSSLASSSQPNSPLAMLSCVADLTLREEFPNATARPREVPVSVSPSEGSYDGDTEDAEMLQEWPTFESGESVRVQMGSSRDADSWRYLTIADLKKFPPCVSERECRYPVLTQTRPRVVTYIDSSRIGRVCPW